MKRHGESCRLLSSYLLLSWDQCIISHTYARRRKLYKDALIPPSASFAQSEGDIISVLLKYAIKSDHSFNEIQLFTQRRRNRQ